MIYVYTDGGSRGNPGEAAWGFYITNKEGMHLAGTGGKIGINTNNVAEYMALIEAFKYVQAHRELFGDTSGIAVRMDSKLVCMQMQGLWKVKHANMIPLFHEASMLAAGLGHHVTYTHIPREQNKMADMYVNRALDNLLES